MSVEQEESQKKKSNVVLSVMSQADITTHWDDIESCIRLSVSDDDDVSTCNAHGAIRRGEMLVIAGWVDGKIKGLAVCRSIEDGYSGNKAMLLYALHGELVTNDEWLDCMEQFEGICRNAGCSKVIAYMSKRHVVMLSKRLGWQTRTIGWKEISHG